MKQKLLEERSPWWPYVRMLPENFNTPPYYSPEDFAWLRGTNLGRASELRECDWRGEFDEMMKALLLKGIPDEKKRLWTWSLYLWAATVMTSRSFPGPAVFDQPEGQFPTYTDNPEGKAPILIPGLDLLNHFPSSRVAWLWDSTACTIKNDEPLSGGGEVPNNYGPKSNEELIMGYGFSLPDNPADHFSIGFSPAITSYVNAAKARRSIHMHEHRKDLERSAGPGTPEATSNHWVCIQDRKPQFSLRFLEDFSIAIENPRERYEADQSPHLNVDILDAPLTRNKLHVICAVFMILQKGQTNIRKYDGDLSERPQHTKQIDAVRYRQNQLDILDQGLTFLAGKLSSLFQEDTNSVTDLQIVRLEDALAKTPKGIQKDVRSVLNTGMKTRDPKKIRQRGGTDFALTVWLCGLWLSQRPYAGDDPDWECLEVNNDARFSRWLRFLLASYPDHEIGLQTPKNNSRVMEDMAKAEWFDPVRNSAICEDTVSDHTSILATYLDAIRVTVDKHPRNFFNNPEVNLRRLQWCYTVIKNEGVWFPNLTDIGEDDEWVLFLDSIEC